MANRESKMPLAGGGIASSMREQPGDDRRLRALSLLLFGLVVGIVTAAVMLGSSGSSVGSLAGGEERTAVTARDPAPEPERSPGGARDKRDR